MICALFQLMWARSMPINRYHHLQTLHPPNSLCNRYSRFCPCYLVALEHLFNYRLNIIYFFVEVLTYLENIYLSALPKHYARRSHKLQYRKRPETVKRVLTESIYFPWSIVSTIGLDDRA
jgi:hypothetical protein